MAIADLLKELLRDELREEIGALQVDVDQTVEGFFARVKQVGSNGRRDTGVVDEEIDRTKRTDRRFDQPAAILRDRDVGLHEQPA